MSQSWSVKQLEEFGRTRLSKSFFMREMLYSEIAQAEGMTNAPSNPDLAIFAGKQLCEKVLEPIQDVWGRIAIRSALRNEEVNDYGNKNKLGCSSNEISYANHIWDHRDKEGFAGATATIVIPSYIDYFEKTGDFASLAWWIYHHIPDVHDLWFFPKYCAFNISWYEGDQSGRYIKTYVENPHTGDKTALLLKGKVHPYYAQMEPEQRYEACLKLI